MAYKHPDLMSESFWREHFPNVRRMRKARWEVWGRCPKCRVRLDLDLCEVELKLGPEFSLWDRRPKCRTMMCGGRMRLVAMPPHVTRPFGMGG